MNLTSNSSTYIKDLLHKSLMNEYNLNEYSIKDSIDLHYKSIVNKYETSNTTNCYYFSIIGIIYNPYRDYYYFDDKQYCTVFDEISLHKMSNAVYNNNEFDRIKRYIGFRFLYTIKFT